MWCSAENSEAVIIMNELKAKTNLTNIAINYEKRFLAGSEDWYLYKIIHLKKLKKRRENFFGSYLKESFLRCKRKI